MKLLFATLALVAFMFAPLAPVEAAPAFDGCYVVAVDAPDASLPTVCEFTVEAPLQERFITICKALTPADRVDKSAACDFFSLAGFNAGAEYTGFNAEYRQPLLC